MSAGASKRARLEGQGFVYPDNNAADLWVKKLKSQQDCDVFFVVGPGRVRIGAHKLVLAAKSPVFEAMFSERWETGSSQESHEIILEDNEPSVINALLEYVYAAVFKATTAVEAVELLHLAQFYDIQTLVNPCKQVLAGYFRLEDLIQIFTSARKYGFSDLMAKVVGLCVNNFVQLANSPSFEKAEETMLISLLQRADFYINESELFTILLKWADKQIENSTMEPKPERQEILKNIIPLVRFPTMTAKELAEVVVPAKVLPEQTTINLFVYLNSSEQIRREIGQRLPYDKSSRKGIAVVDLYSKSSRPGSDICPRAALIKSSKAIDILTFTFNCSKRPGMTQEFPKCRITSLLLERPRYGQVRFQNSSEVAQMELPTMASIFLSRVIRISSVKPRSQVGKVKHVTVRDERMEVVVDGWELVNGTRYQIGVRYVDDTYILPKIVGSTFSRPRNERFDLFNGKTLRPQVAQENSSGTMTFSSLDMSGHSSKFDTITNVESVTIKSSGLHLVRSLRIAFD